MKSYGTRKHIIRKRQTKIHKTHIMSKEDLEYLASTRHIEGKRNTLNLPVTYITNLCEQMTEGQRGTMKAKKKLLNYLGSCGEP